MPRHCVATGYIFIRYERIQLLYEFFHVMYKMEMSWNGITAMSTSNRSIIEPDCFVKVLWQQTTPSA